MTKNISWKLISFPIYVILFGFFFYKIYPLFGTKFMGERTNLAFFFLVATQVLAAALSLYSCLKKDGKPDRDWMLRGAVALIGLIFDKPAIIYARLASWFITIMFAPIMKVLEWWGGRMNLFKVIFLLALTIATLIFLAFAGILYYGFIILNLDFIGEFIGGMGESSGSTSSVGGYSDGYQKGGSMGYSYDDDEDGRPDYAGAALNFVAAYCIAKELERREEERQEMIREDPMSQYRI